MPAAANRLHGAKIEAIMPEDDMDLDGDESQDIVYVKLNRNRKQLRHELSTGATLKPYRDNLEEKDLNGATTRDH